MNNDDIISGVISGLVVSTLILCVFIMLNIITTKSCAPVNGVEVTAEVPADSRYTPTMNLDMTQITWVRDPELIEQKFSEYLEDNPIAEDETLWGLATWGWPDDRCVIHAYEPMGEEDEFLLMVLGHEVLHCFRGDFHD